MVPTLTPIVAQERRGDLLRAAVRPGGSIERRRAAVLLALVARVVELLQPRPVVHACATC